MKLTKNEQEVLKRIIEQGRISDTEISEDLAVTQQAVNQIRKRLEDENIIKGYMPVINFEKIGIRLLNFVGIEILPSLWDNHAEHEINSKLLDIPFLFQAFRISDADISYLLIFGFEDIKEKELFSRKIESELSGQVNIKWSYTATVQSILAYDSLNLVYSALRKEPVEMQKVVRKMLKK